MKRKSEKIIDALGSIDDKYVLECVPLLFAPPRRRRTPWLVAAACLALCILAAPKAWPYISEYMLSNPGIEEVQPDNQSQEDVQPNIPDNKTALPELPVLTLGSAYVGEEENETLYTYEASGLVVGSPMDLSDLPETLPVYENPCPTYEGGEAEGWTADHEAMEAALVELAEQFDVDGEIVWYTRSYEDAAISNDTWQIDVAYDLTATMRPMVNVTLPEGCGSYTLTEAEASATWLLAAYGEKFQMEQPAAAVRGGATNIKTGTPCYEVVLYDAAGSEAEQLASYSLQGVVVELEGANLKWMYTSRQAIPETVGEYPILSLEEATTLWEQGYGLSASTKEPGQIVQAELVYETWTWMDYWMPYYRLYVELGTGEPETEMNSYGIYYVPAVRPEYLTDTPSWKELDFADKLRTAPDLDGVGNAAKEAFITYFREHPDYMAAYGDYDLTFSRSQVEDQEIAVLKCNGPLMVNTGASQTFWYFYDDGAVEFGPSGTWSPETVDYAEAVRRMLTERDPDMEDYKTYLQEAFARYYLDHYQELQLLPEFDKSSDPDWEALCRYILLLTKPGETFTVEEWYYLMSPYIDTVYSGGTSSLMTYDNGVYTVNAMDFALDAVYYRLTNLEALEEDVYQASFEGFTLPYEELLAYSFRNPESQNMKLLLEYTGLPAESVEWTNIEQSVLEATWTRPASLEDQGFAVSERLTVTFRLWWKGDHPFQYLSCAREITGEGQSYVYDVGDFQVSFTLPDSWTDACEIIPFENEIGFYHKASMDDWGGRIFELVLKPQESTDANDYHDYGGFVRDLASVNGYNLVLFEPTDVQGLQEEYRTMRTQVDSIAATVSMWAIE